MRLMANRELRYPDDGSGGTHMPGDIFEAPDAHAAILIVTKLASPVPVVEIKQRYKTRRMQTEDTA